MKRPWVVVLTAALALGCRSSQPTTNPFLRTTVPPPGTGQAAVVTPGEPYVPGAAPPAVVGPGTTTAPVVPIDPSAVPITPPPAGAPVVAPQPVPPPVKNNKYFPPGGSYIYNQSSIEKPGKRSSQLAARPIDDADLEGEENQLADAKAGGADNSKEPPMRLDDVELDEVRDVVRQVAPRVKSDPVELASYQGDAELDIEQASHFGEPMPSHARVAKLVAPSNANSIRVLGTSEDSVPSPEDVPAASAPAAATLKITAGGTDSSAVQRAQWVVKEPSR